MADKTPAEKLTAAAERAEKAKTKLDKALADIEALKAEHKTAMAELLAAVAELSGKKPRAPRAAGHAAPRGAAQQKAEREVLGVMGDLGGDARASIIIERVGSPKSAVWRALQSLVAQGKIARVASGLYRLAAA